jgi:serine/threonine-protein kinase
MANGPHLPGLELLELLGSGGMGVVFKARQTTLGREVAVKFLRDAHREGARQQERFLQEARAVARLKHPNLVQLYEFGETPSNGGTTAQPYLVLEYVSGGSLADRLRGSSLPPGDTARLVETLAGAIHYAHEQGVIHRDLKPANILLSQEDKETRRQGDKEKEGANPVSWSPSLLVSLSPKITDFGLAKCQSDTGLTRTGDVLGTPSYMSPEQTVGKSTAITAAVDVYGLGAILYEALTGRPPFRAETEIATLSQVQQEEPVPPRRLQPTVPRDLETICLKCLRKEPGRRYATAQELADELRRFLAGESIQARPVGTGERVLRWCRRKPGVAGLLAALLLVFLAGLSSVLVLWQRDRQHAADFKRERDIALHEQERAEHHLRGVREGADRLTKLGNELRQRPGLADTGTAVLEEALTFYEQLLPEQGTALAVRLEAAQLYGRLAGIHHTLGHWDKAVDAYGQQANVLSNLLAEEPPKVAHRYQLANSHRYRGNVLRDLRKLGEAREAYDQAAELQEQLLRESPNDAGSKVALANTLLNKATVLSSRDEAEPLERLYNHILELYRAAVANEPDNLGYRAELALGLEEQGLFVLNRGRTSQAMTLVREALTIHQQLLASRRMPRSFERYVALNYASLGKVQAAAGQLGSAEQSYREGIKFLEQLVKEFPHLVFYRLSLAQTMAGLAALLEAGNRRPEAETIRAQVVSLYETLMATSPKNTENLRGLVQSYVAWAVVLGELGRYAEAADRYHKALQRDPESPGANNALAWFLATSPDLSSRNAAEAVELAQKAVTASPQTGSYWNTLGAARYRSGDYQAALVALESAMRLRGEGNGCDWFLVAMAKGRLGARDEARSAFERAVQWMEKHKPKDVELRRFRAEANDVLAEMSKP